MVQEACDSVEVLGSHYRSDPHSISSGVLQDLKEYFRRPIVMIQKSCDLNVPVNQYFASIDSSTMPLFFSGFANRLLGVAGMTFDIVFTLQVSSLPFCQGLLALSWQYDVGSIQLDRTVVPTLCTNLPHVRLDLTENTMVQLRVPFLQAVQFFDLRTTWFYGKVGINSILPIRVGVAGNSIPSMRVLMHLENLRLYHAAPISTASVQYQVGGKSPIEAEFESEAYPFSSGVSSMGRTLRWVAKGIPSLSSIAGPASWFLGKTAGAIRAYGYSKPLVQEPTKRVWNNSTIMEHNVDVATSALMVGHLASSRLKVDENIACTDVDEMSLAFVLSQWSQLARFSFDTTNTSNTNLWGTPITPSCFWYKGQNSAASFNRNPFLSSPSNATSNCFIPTNLFWWGQLFRQWKGDIEFRFTFSKTKMHAGRVLVAFNPIGQEATYTAGPGPTAVSLQTVDTAVPFGYSAIFDLRDNNVFTFTVPYYSILGFTDFWSYTGSLVMKVFDPLMASPVTSPNIQCLVEVRAGDGFEFAMPQTLKYVPAAHNATPVYQSGVVKTIKPDMAEQAVGEVFTSVKQLISIPSVITPGTDYFLSQGISALGGIFLGIKPWFKRPPPPAGALPNTTVYNTLDPKSFNNGAYATNAYLYVRGGTDVHINAVSPTPFTFCAFQILTENTATLIDRVFANAQAWLTGYSAHFRFPGYQYAARTSVANVPPAAPISAIGPSISFVADQYACGVKVMNTSSNAAAYQTRICAADDAMLGHYIGPVYLALANGDANITEFWSAYYQTTGTETLGLVAPPVDETIKSEPPPVTEPVTALPALKVNTLVSPFEPTPPIPITSGDGGVFPSARAGGLTRSLPRAGRVNVEEVKSILDSLVES